MNKFIRQGDTVRVIAGNDKGKWGKVLSRRGERLIVEGVNIRKKHMRKTQSGAGRIIEIERPIHISNVQFALKDGKAVKVKIQRSEGGEKELVYLENDKLTSYRSATKAGE